MPRAIGLGLVMVLALAGPAGSSGPPGPAPVEWRTLPQFRVGKWPLPLIGPGAESISARMVDDGVASGSHWWLHVKGMQRDGAQDVYSVWFADPAPDSVIIEPDVRLRLVDERGAAAPIVEMVFPFRCEPGMQVCEPVDILQGFRGPARDLSTGGGKVFVRGYLAVAHGALSGAAVGVATGVQQ